MSELIESQQTQKDLKGPFQESQPTENPSQSNEIDSDMFSKKKNQFRVEIRKKQIKSVLQAKRNKAISWFSSDPHLFHADLPNQTFNEFQAVSPDLELIKNNLRVIDQAVSDMQDNAAQLVKESPLLNKLVDMITWGRNQPFEAFEAAYNIVLNVTANIDCIDVVDFIAEKLLCEDQNGKIIPAQNNQLYYNSETRAEYRLSYLEDHLASDQDIDIRQNAINLLANISAEPSEFSRKAILSKAKLFPIILENIELKNYNDTFLECIVNLIANLSLNSSWFTYQDFNDLPELLNSVLLLVPYDSYQQQAALTAFETILSIADDDDIHQLVNDNYSLLTTIYKILQSSNINTDIGYKIVESGLEILQNICDWTESLTQQAVDMGLFDPVAFLILNDAPKRLIILSLELLASCFSKKSSSINEIFLNDHTFNENQTLTRKLITLANISQKGIKNSALEAIGELLLNANLDQCKCLFQDSRLIRTFLDALQSDAVETSIISLILEALCNLIFMGNLQFSVEENPYTLDFLAKNGFTVLDAISETLPNEAFSHSDRLISLLVDGNIDFSSNQ